MCFRTMRAASFTLYEPPPFLIKSIKGSIVSISTYTPEGGEYDGAAAPDCDSQG